MIRPGFDRLLAARLRAEYVALGAPQVARFECSVYEQGAWLDFLRPWVDAEGHGGHVSAEDVAAEDGPARFVGTNVPPKDRLPAICTCVERR